MTRLIVPRRHDRRGRDWTLCACYVVAYASIVALCCMVVK